LKKAFVVVFVPAHEKAGFQRADRIETNTARVSFERQLMYRSVAELFKRNACARVDRPIMFLTSLRTIKGNQAFRTLVQRIIIFTAAVGAIVFSPGCLFLRHAAGREKRSCVKNRSHFGDFSCIKKRAVAILFLYKKNGTVPLINGSKRKE
jgi:hypothetical protein